MPAHDLDGEICKIRLVQADHLEWKQNGVFDYGLVIVMHQSPAGKNYTLTGEIRPGNYF
jgi:hypothetical protein